MKKPIEILLRCALAVRAAVAGTAAGLWRSHAGAMCPKKLQALLDEEGKCSFISSKCISGAIHALLYGAPGRGG